MVLKREMTTGQQSWKNAKKTGKGAWTFYHLLVLLIQQILLPIVSNKYLYLHPQYSMIWNIMDSLDSMDMEYQWYGLRKTRK